MSATLSGPPEFQVGAPVCLRALPPSPQNRGTIVAFTPHGTPLCRFPHIYGPVPRGVPCADLLLMVTPLPPEPEPLPEGARVALKGRPLTVQSVGLVVARDADGRYVVRFPNVYGVDMFKYGPAELQALPDAFPVVPATLTADVVPPRLGAEVPRPPKRKPRPRCIASPVLGWADVREA